MDPAEDSIYSYYLAADSDLDLSFTSVTTDRTLSARNSLARSSLTLCFNDSLSITSNIVTPSHAVRTSTTASTAATTTPTGSPSTPPVARHHFIHQWCPPPPPSQTPPPRRSHLNTLRMGKYIEYARDGIERGKHGTGDHALEPRDRTRSATVRRASLLSPSLRARFGPLLDAYALGAYSISTCA